MKHYDGAFKIDLTNVHILRDLGRLCMQSGDLDRAQKTYRALLLQKLGPDSGIAKADVYFHLGQISFQHGDKIKAKAMLERAVAEAGDHPEAKSLLDRL
jgi:tetratricopeptide (TPR) repeat protein